MLIILILATPKFKFLTKEETQEETQQYLFLLKVSIPKNIQILVSMLFNDTKYINKKKHLHSHYVAMSVTLNLDCK